jgi:peptidoglycan/LPS O-acetylase OafA/YrhL
MVLSVCLLSPFGAQQTVALTGLGAMLLVANFVISKYTGGYFDLPAESNPLLHTWSLSVEEQFYLMFPAILLLGWLLSRRGRRIRWAPVLVGTAAAISLWEAMIGTWALGPVLARWATYLVGFYGPFARVWEFAVGALLSLVTASRLVRSARHARVLAWLGVALLAGSAWLINRTTPFPGLWTLLPVAGTLLVITAGIHHTTWVNRALALPPMVKIGDWSYSLYLWHWPLMVFAVILWPEAPSARVLAGALSFLPAVASYRWVEQPIRQLPPLTRRRTCALVAAVVSPTILLAGTAGFAADHYWLPRYRTEPALLAHQGGTGYDEFFLVLQKNYYQCIDQAIRDGISEREQWHGAPRCWQSKPGSHRDVALVGDSHIESLFLGLAEALPDKNIVYYYRNALPIKPVEGAVNTAPDYGQIIDLVASDPAMKTVLINDAWARRPLQGATAEGFVKTLQAFTSKGKAVFVMDDVPWFPFDAVACKYRTPILPRAQQCSIGRNRFEDSYASYYPELRAAVDKVPGVQFLNTAHDFCDDEICSMLKGEILVYRDSNHLNNVGSEYLANRMLADFPQFRAALTQR